MNRKVLIVLLTIISIGALGQSNNEKVDRLVDLLCDCASKAKSKDEFELCERIVQPADSLADGDKLYLLRQLIGQCNNALEKYLGPRRDSLKIESCLFLHEEDIKDYNFKKAMRDERSIYWTASNPGQVMKDLTDERRKFESENLAIEYIDQQRELTESEGIKPISLPIEKFQSAEVFNFGNVGSYYLYHVYARRGKLVCFLVISLSIDDLEIIKNLLGRVSGRVINCK
jgi:hypothetical protein